MPDPEVLFAWAHLSDLRLGPTPDLILDRLCADLAKASDRDSPAPEAILITGDIADVGSDAHYAAARTWLDDLAKAACITSDAIHIVPGERDIDPAANEDHTVEYLLAALRSGKPTLDAALAHGGDRALLVKRRAPYLAFAGPDPFWTRIIERPGLRIRLIGLDTGLLAGSDDQGKLQLGNAQLTQTLVGAGDDELLLVLSHHPFRGGWLADQVNADGWIANHAHVHLTGHVDAASSELANSGAGRPFLRIASGHARHSYNVAALVRHADGALAVRIWPRVWSDAHKRFVRNVGDIPEDRSWAEHVIASGRVEAASESTARAQAAQGIGESLGSLRPLAPLPPYEGPGGVPITPVPHFLGRDDEMRDLRAKLAADRAVCIVATGLGGIGKTSLIRQYVATEAAATFPDGSVWIDAMSLDGDAARACERFGYHGERRPTVPEASRFLASALHHRRVLVVIDNVFPDRVDVATLPIVCGTSRTVITSRSLGLHESLGSPAQPLLLGKWSEGACRTYMRDVAKNVASASDRSLDALSAFVGRLPLAVRLLARLLMEDGMTPARLLRHLQREPLGTLDTIELGADRGVAATFKASYKGLDEAERRVLLALAACARVTSEGWVARVAALEEERAFDLLRALARRSLVECVDRDARLWTLHDVVRLFARAQNGASEAYAAHLALAEQHVEAHQKPLDWPAMEAGMDEVLAAVDRLVAVEDAPRAATLVGRAAEHLMQRGRYSELIAHYEQLATQLPGGSNALAIVLGNAGLCYRMLGDLPRAIEHHQHSLAIEETRGNLEGQACTLGNLGACYQQQGDVPRAIEHYQHSLAIGEKLDSFQGQADQLGNLGTCFREQGDFPRAIEHLQRSLAINEKLGRFQGQADQLSNLGLCFSERGDFPRAIEHHQRSLAIEEKLGRLTGQAISLHNLGDCYLAQGHPSLALDHLDRALALWRRIGFPDHHPYVRETLAVFARLRLPLGGGGEELPEPES